MRIEDRILTPLVSQDEGGEEAPKEEGAGEEGAGEEKEEKGGEEKKEGE